MVLKMAWRAGEHPQREFVLAVHVIAIKYSITNRENQDEEGAMRAFG